MNKELLYYIPSGEFGKEGVLSLLRTHPEIRFVSLVGIDLAGNDTDEKIPIEIFMKDYDDFFEGKAVQTDGSSVVLMDIATLNDARVDMVADAGVNWYVDYNEENLYTNGRPVGTLRIPCFLLHNGKFIDSRSILRDSCKYVASELKKLLASGKPSGAWKMFLLLILRISVSPLALNLNSGSRRQAKMKRSSTFPFPSGCRNSTGSA